ncbi:hypothetical protein [Bacteroides pyogenes]|uniref:hypothetical protein n=1 Tax=Bacteroides pyogenes TaxID=310300 RepID=UPI000587CA41|nr:hypothetical protein [Bacteroides pyogenes]
MPQRYIIGNLLSIPSRRVWTRSDSDGLDRTQMDLNNPAWVWSHTEVFGDKEELLLRSEAGRGNFCPERGGSFHLRGENFRPEAEEGESLFREQTKSP